ncbi:MAG: ATP-binding protein [Proteobacteria bacterium]|nr:ATP-binding protein [Pseudomonadota bacterium]
MSPVRFRIADEADLQHATAEAHQAFLGLGATETQAAKFRTAVSELVRNILKYADRGHLVLTELTDGHRVGMRALVADKGPGIADLELALADAYSTSGTLGLGLPGVRRLVDQFHIESEPGSGTRVTIEVWT